MGSQKQSKAQVLLKIFIFRDKYSAYM